MPAAATKSRNDDLGGPSPPSSPKACPSDMDSVNPQDITLGPIIGNGAFSTVFSATYQGQRVALKRQAYGEHILRELSILKQIDHPSLLRYIGSCEYNHQDTKEVWILSEFVGGGDVSKYLKGKKSPHLTWKETVQIALDAAEGLRYMHEKRIIHRDVKAANMLLDENLRIRLCDFGFARTVASENNSVQDDGPSPPVFQKRGRRMSLCGTDTYMPPEMLFEEDYNESADIFSYGVVLMELLCRRHINEGGFLKRQPAKNFVIDMDEFRSSVRPSCPPSLVLLAENCTAYEPCNRPTAREVVDWLEDLQKDLNDNQSFRRSSSSFGGHEGDDDACLSDSFVSSADAHYDVDSGDDDGDHAAQHGDDDAHFDETSAPTYAGPLLMPHGHMHRWRQRWVVIRDSMVWVFKNQKQYQLHRELEEEEAYSDGKRSAKLPISTSLAGCVLKQKTNTRRWTLTHAARDIKWKFQASTSHDMQLWVAIVTRAITVATYLAAGDGPAAAEDPIDTTDEIYTWLAALGLTCYFHTFKTKGFATLDFLRETGLGEDDFNFLDIQDESDRQTLTHATLVLRGEAV